MARSNPLTWRNIGQPSFGGQPGHETAARAFESASKGFRDAADFAQGRRTDTALADLMSDGKIERGELGGLRGVDMKTILDAQRLDETSRGQAGSRLLNDRVLAEQAAKAEREGSPEAIQRQREREDAADKLALTKAKTEEERLKLQQKIDARTEGLLTDSTNARQSYQSGLDTTMQTAFEPGGKYSKEVMYNNYLQKNRTQDNPNWEPTPEQQKDFEKEYSRIRSSLERTAVNEFTQDFMNKNPIASQYISELPGVKAYQNSVNLAEGAAADITAAAIKESNKVIDSLGGESGYAFMAQNDEGQFVPSKKSQKATSITETTGALLKGFNLKPEVSRGSVKAGNLWSNASKWNETNQEGLTRVLEAAGGHTGIVESVMRDAIKKDSGWYDAANYVEDWQPLVDAAKEKRTAAQAAADLYSRTYKEQQGSRVASPLLEYTGN